MKTFKLFNFNERTAMVQAEGCAAARQKIGVTPRTTSTIGRFASVLCLILTMLFTLGVGEIWAGTKRVYCEYSGVSSWWSTIYVYAWGGGKDPKKYTMVSTGTSNLVRCDIDDYHTDLLFYKSTSQGGSWETQSVDVSIGSNNRWSLGDGGWGNKGTISNQQRYAPGTAIDGLVDRKNPHNQMFSDGTYSVELEAHKTYEFKILETSTLYGLNDCFAMSNLSATTLNTSGYQIRLCTAGAGTYTFSYNTSNHKLSITFPTVTHPSIDYCYLIKYGGWGAYKYYIWNCSSTKVAEWDGDSNISGNIWPGTVVSAQSSISGSNYLYIAPGEFANVQFNDGSNGNKSADYNTSDGWGKYAYHNGSAWVWGTWNFAVTLQNQVTTTSAPSNPSVQFNGDAPSDLTAPACSFYTFGGYYTAAGGGGSQVITAAGKWNASVSGYTDGSKKWIHEGGAATLYGKWTQSITLNQNGATTDGSTSLAATYNAVLDASGITNPSKTGYTFDGWTTAQNSGSVVINASKAVQTVASWTDGSKKWIHNAASTLYAKWTAIDYNVTYSAPSNGNYTIKVASGTASSATKTANYAQTITIAATPTTGYHFVSWTIKKTSDNSDVTSSVSLSSSTNKDATFTMPAYGVTVTATFAIDTYAITYAAGTYGSGSLAGGTKTYGVSYTLSSSSSAFTRTGYTYDGWSTAAAGSSKNYNLGGSYTTNAAQTFYPHWVVTNYTIGYTLNGGSVAVDNPTSYTIESSAITLNNPTKTGYTFAGWTGTGLASATTTVTIAAGSTGNRSYTATWTANTNTAYTVKHYKQKLDGTYDATPDDTDNLTGTTASSVTPAVKSYEGFTAPSTQTKTIAADGTMVIEYKYTRNSYTLTWALNGGSISSAGTAAGSVKYGASLTAPTVTKAGYEFAGWSPAVPATMPAANSTYTATWTAAVASVTIGGSTTYYAAITDAWSAANGAASTATITMLQNVTVTSQLSYTNSQNCTLDLNGYTITSNTAVQKPLYINNASTTFTITDGSVGKAGKLSMTSTFSSDDIYGAHVATGALILNAGTIEVSSGSKPTNGVTISDGATFTMNDGTIHVTTTNSKTGHGVYLGTATINGGTVIVEADGNAAGLRCNKGTHTVTGGKFNITSSGGTAYVSSTTGTTTIQGGYFNINRNLAACVSAPYHVFTVSPALEDTYNYEVATGYTLTWSTDGDDLTGTYTSGITKVGTTIVAPNTPTKTGYTFSAWSPTPAATMPAANTEYTATWTANEYSVTLDREGGTTGATSVTMTYDANTLGGYSAPTKTGYTFGGYWTGDNGTGTLIITTEGALTSATVSGYTSSGKWIKTTATTLYAKWTAIDYTVTYSAPSNGNYTIKVASGTASSESKTANYGQTITLAATPSNATFYKFDEWTVTGATPASTTSANTTFTMPAGNVTVAASFVQVNLAEGKTVVAGYEPDNANEHSDKITDGRTDNDAWVTWVNQDAADEWFYVDLGAFYQLNNLEVVWGADYSTDYIIQARQNAPASSAEAADDKCWFTLAEVTDATANSTKSTSVSAPARYIRLHSLSRSSNCIRVKEFRVFGTATATAYTTPTLSTAEVDNYPSNYEDVVLHLVGTDSKSTAIHTYKITDESSNVSIVTTDGDNLVTISGLSKFEHHTLTVQAMDPGALLSASQNVAVLIWDPTYNMAQGKTIVAGYEPGNADEHSEYAVDGSTSTGWTTYDKQPESVEWFYVDLGAYYQLSRIELVWGEVYSTDYVLEVRQDVPATSAIAADDNLWFPVAEVKDATASSTKSTAVDVRARYVRFHSLSRSAGFLRLYEFRVFTTRFADADTNVPVITTATASYNDDGKAYLNLTATDVEDGTTKWFYLYNPATSSYSLQQTNGSNQIVIDGLTECENYTFQVQAMDTAAKLSVVSNIAVRVPIISTTNLARGKTATAGTTQGGFVAANAVDGNTGTMWSGNYDRKDNENQWISIDLADKYSIDSIKITWGGDDRTWPQDYELQVSYDGSDYQPIGHYTTKPANQNCKYTFTNVSARYVRVWAITAGSTYGMEICEIAVHGDCYDDTELPIMLFAEAEEHNVYVSAADIYVGAIHKSIASDNLLYHVEYSSTGGDSGSRTISPANITNGAFSLDELRDGDTYTVNIWAAKTSDISSNRSANYRTVSFTTLELGGYTQYYFAGNMNEWLGVNNPAGWSPDPVEWRFKTTAINGIYKLSHSVSTTQDWVACFVYDKNNSIRTANDHTISVTKDNDFIITMKGLESYISNSHTIYIAGDAVGTAVDAEDAAHALTWTDGTHASWEGYVTSGETFKLIFHDQGAAGNKRTNVLTPSAVTYDESAQYAKITFDLDTWEYEWSATDVSTYIYDDHSGDGKWSTTSNWLSGALPTIEKDVIITKPVTVDITTARAKSVIIDKSDDNSGQLVLDAGKELVVATTVRKTTDGSSYTATGENDIVFNSTSGAGLGALAIGSHATANGLNNATVNFSTLSNGSTANETAASASDAQYVGTPFSNRPAMLYQFYNSWMYKFINTGVPGWTRVDGEDGLEAFKGYCIFSADGTNHVYWMQGTLVASEDQSINLQYNGGDGSNANNENMLANSWMAPIKIAAFQASDFTNADATIYIYNTGSPDDYKNNSGASTTGTSAGQYTTYTPGTAGTAIIPSMQAFSVYTHGSTPSISLDYSKIVYDPAVAGSVVPGGNRAPQRTETDEPEKMRLYIGAESGYGDMLYMLEREDFAEGFENGWDGRKMFGEDVAPQLYAFTPDGNMAINCIPTFEGQLLGFRKGAQDNTYTFTFEYDGDNMWYLNDLKEQTSTLISAFDSYTFTSEADDTEARFIISRSPIHSTPTAVESATGAQQPAIRKIVINDHVFIIRNGLMYDVTGIMVR